MDRRSPVLLLVAGAALALTVSACSTTEPSAAAEAPPSSTTAAPPPTSSTTTTSTSSTTTSTTTTTTTSLPPTFPLRGTVSDPNGQPLSSADVQIGEQTVTTGDDGSFHIESAEAGLVTVSRPAWLPQEFAWTGPADIDIVMEPRIVRGLRVSKYVFEEEGSFERLGELLALSTANTLVFDTKDETGEVLYESAVAKAHELGAVSPVYDVSAALDSAREWGAYTITRIVTFEDRIWAEDPDAKLAGFWVDPTDAANWEYPIALGIEACELGFDEIQFDYVRFPAGSTATAAQRARPLTADQRVDAIRAFLVEARSRLHPLGCAISADVFGIVMSSPTDEGIGQRAEEFSTAVDAVSPMIYPSHYSPGWLGFEDPNDHPGAVVADALDQGTARFSGTALMRPWLQAFYYNGAQVQAGIAEAEERGMGWLLWNVASNYAESWLPPDNG